MNKGKKLFTLMALCASFTTVQAAKRQPNVIVILADDMGYADAGFTGCKDIKTPNIDKLAKDGVVCTNGYSNHPFSGPSRAALMSGRYQYRFGFEANPGHDQNSMQGVSLSETLFPKRMQDVGYTTGVIGKWHLGAAPALHPLSRGFDYFYGFLGGSHDYYRSAVTDPIDNGIRGALMRNHEAVTFDGYLTRLFSAEAVKFVEDNKSKPFFLYLSYNAPHEPLQAPKADKDRYANIADPKRRTYAAMVDIMDEGIGDVVEALKKSGVYEDTLIFFLSDNGGPLRSSSCNDPFRGQKGSMYEGGIHVPFVVSWPAKIKGGREYDYPINSIDISRTAVAVAKGNTSSAPEMEGVNLIPYITGKNKKAPHDMIFWRAGNGISRAAVCADGYKYIIRGNKVTELFDLNEDVSEQKNLATGATVKVKEISDAVAEWNMLNIDNVIVPMKKH